jgi:hypothetical protein
LFSRALHRSKKIVIEEAIYLEVVSWKMVPQEGFCRVLQGRTSAIAYAAGLFPWGSRPCYGRGRPPAGSFGGDRGCQRRAGRRRSELSGIRIKSPTIWGKLGDNKRMNWDNKSETANPRTERTTLGIRDATKR